MSTLDAKASAWGYLSAALRAGSQEPVERVEAAAETAEAHVQATKVSADLVVVNAIRGGANVTPGVTGDDRGP